MAPIDDILELIKDLTPTQEHELRKFVLSLTSEGHFEANPDSDVATQDFCTFIARRLQHHHSQHEQPLTKLTFEYLLRDALRATGHDAEKASNGLPGEDLRVDGQGWSCKTQADRNISTSHLHISKFMELGKGAWESERDIAALRDRMVNHMKAYERIFSLRMLERTEDREMTSFKYELVEIPKSLLAESTQCPIEMMWDSKQTPKPAYIRVKDLTGRTKFDLYFDGGTERKLQIKKIDKDLCMVHATWVINVES